MLFDSIFWLAFIIISFGILIATGVLGVFALKNDSNYSLENSQGGLSEDTKRYLGKKILVETHYGHGWSRLDSNAPDQELEVPESFEMRLTKLVSFTSRGNRKGGVGKIEHKGHAFDNYWVVFVPRWTGSWNFTDRIGPSNIVIGPMEPVDVDDVWKSMPNGEPVLAGFCEVRALTSNYNPSTN